MLINITIRREELRARERENKLRATEYMRQLKEMEEKEAELERIAEEARMRSHIFSK